MLLTPIWWPLPHLCNQIQDRANYKKKCPYRCKCRQMHRLLFSYLVDNCIPLVNPLGSNFHSNSGINYTSTTLFGRNIRWEIKKIARIVFCKLLFLQFHTYSNSLYLSRIHVQRFILWNISNGKYYSVILWIIGIRKQWRCDSQVEVLFSLFEECFPYCTHHYYHHHYQLHFTIQLTKQLEFYSTLLGFLFNLFQWTNLRTRLLVTFVRCVDVRWILLLRISNAVTGISKEVR